jgi:hypothetical protein
MIDNHMIVFIVTSLFIGGLVKVFLLLIIGAIWIERAFAICMIGVWVQVALLISFGRTNKAVTSIVAIIVVE